jgi:pimeloyl-ACP methyl ester carboxylesterase
VKEINRRILGVAVTLILAATLATPLTSTVLAKKATGTDMGNYTQYVGTLGGANYVIRIPDGWNGGLVVGCHGYMGAVWFPDAQFVMDGLVNGDGIGLPLALVEQGFAYAASSYGEGGWPIKEAMIRTHQLTEYVIDKFGVTGKVFIIGHSMGGAIALMLGQKYPELYDGVLDISAMRDTTLGYLATVAVINGPMWPTIPAPLKAQLLQMKADMEAQYGGTYDEKPKAYERLNPSSNAKISIPVVTVYGTKDMLTSPQQAASYGIAVAAAGCSEYYRLYPAINGLHEDSVTVDAALIHFEELVDYPVGW